MPMYEFQCSSGHRTEKFLSVSESDKAIKCPDCGKRAKRAVSLTGAPILKPGVGGFYKPSLGEKP